MFLKNLFNKNGDQLAKEAIDDYSKNRDEFAVIDKLQKAIKLGIKYYPLDQIYLHIGASYYDLSLYEKAKEAYEKAYEINPKNSSLVSNLGLSYDKLGMPEKALQFYFEALKVNPNHSFAYNNIGVYYYDSGKCFEALEYLDKAIEIKPNLAVAHAVKARCLSEIGNKKEALKYLQNAKRCGYDNCDGLRKDIDSICNSHPNLFWNKEKFIELSTILSNNDFDLIKRIELVIENPYLFFKENEDTFFLKNFTSFEIANILPLALLLDYLHTKNLLLIVEQDNDLQGLVENIKQLVRKFIDIDDEFFDEFCTEQSFYEVDDLIISISSKIKLLFNLEIIDI
jgi:hypothetical protein